MKKSPSPSAYDKLVQASKEITLLNSIEQLLLWDLETYIPKDAVGSRSEQIELLSAIIHEKKIDKSYEKLLGAIIDLKSGKYKDPSLDEEKKSALREWKRDFLSATKLPTKFVKELAKTTSEGEKIWAKARKKNSFADFQPFLEKIIKLNIEKAEILGYEQHPYDALLDLYEPDLTVKTIDPLFLGLKNGLIRLIEKIAKCNQVKTDFLTVDCDSSIQWKLSKKIMSLMGLDESFCRIDESSHPFSTSFHNTDIRMTTRIDKNFFPSNISSTLHEGGHSLYQRQLPTELFGTPLAEPVSFGVHESQSRFWETFIGKSYSFNKFFYPEIQKELPNTLKNISLDDYYKAINKVSPSFIRIEADEVTYSLHIIIRYEIEKALIAKELSAKDIPSIWNEKMKKYLNITPRSDDVGCLQDIHWSLGYFGYFPSYSLGNLYAGCFFKAFSKEIPTYKKQIEKGNLSAINDWLKENIHKHGRRYNALQLIERVTKAPFSPEPYLTYLNEKYSDIYGF